MIPGAPKTLTIDEALQEAVALHQAGRLAEAEQIYRAILELQADHPDANHNLGVLAGQIGQPAAGLFYLKTALSLNPDHGQFVLSYAEALLMTGQANEAVNILQSAMQRGVSTFAAQALLQSAEGVVQEDIASDRSGRKFLQTELSQVEFYSLAELFNAGRYAELESRTRLLVEQYPNSGIVWKHYGVALAVQGKADHALPVLQKAAELQPDDAEIHNVLGNVLQELGQLDEAGACYRRALDINPDFAEGRNNLGVTLKDLGQLDEAAENFHRAIEINADYAEAHYNLGLVCERLGKNDEAVASYRRTLEINPDDVEACSNLGNVLACLEQFDEAQASIRRGLEINPENAEMLNNLGAVSEKLGQHDDAMASYRHALEIKPDYAEAHYNLGNALKDLGQFDAAVSSYLKALEINPHLAEANFNLGIVLKDFGRFDDSVTCYQLALASKPDYAEVHCGLGCVHAKLGEIDDAMACFRRALQLNPRLVDAHSNLIYTLDLAEGHDTGMLQQERRRWDLIHAVSLTSPLRPHANSFEPDKRLRIGYISADFRKHSAAIGFGAMLTQFDPAVFDVFAYSNSSIEDDHTRRFRQSVTCWRKIVGLPDAAVANLVRQDGIDILVDLSGHSGGNRLLVFARKPAPIQITAWGYAGGTGMNAMDVMFSDPIVVPQEEKACYAEEVRYLPSVISAYFPSPFPEISPLPAAITKQVVFGSFNRLIKLSAATFAAWAQILQAIPSSRMVLKTPELDDGGTRERIAEQFIQAGVDLSLITLLGSTSWRDHVATFRQIDISLDPFPQSGGVTTLEGLMMGVPLVTLRGNTFVGRGSASILTTLGLTDWIAESPAQYVDIAIQKANNLTALAALRQQLRELFTSSIIGDTQAYVRAVEQEYRQLWRELCARREAGN